MVGMLGRAILFRLMMEVKTISRWMPLRLLMGLGIGI